MKKFKVSLLAILAIAGGLVASSFTMTHSPKKFDSAWFTYNGSGSLTDPSNYTIQTTEPDCNTDEVLCAIFVTNADGQPDQDALNALYTSTGGFTHPVDGEVIFKDR